MRRAALIFSLLLAASLASVACVNQQAALGPGLTGTQQLVASAALDERAGAAALKTAHDSALLLQQAGVLSNTDAASVLRWIGGAAHANDNAIAITKAAEGDGSPAGVQAALLAVATAIEQQPSIVDVKDPASQKQVSALLAAVVAVATDIQKEFGE